MRPIPSHPILSCDEARALEEKIFSGDEPREWAAMQSAGRAVAKAVLDDFQEIGGFPAAGRVLVLAGKGHNGGDALLTTHAILTAFPAARAEVVFAFGERALRPLAARAWRELAHAAAKRVKVIAAETVVSGYDLALDGIFGFQFRPPLDAGTAALFKRINVLPVRLRAAVDLPSGLDAPDAFRADFTYATGSVKAPLLTLPNAGRVRYINLGFFREPRTPHPADDRVLTAAVLEPLSELRSAQTDKRSHGHLLMVAGSGDYPGAALMSVQSALRSGVGLVTALVPESLAAAFAARAPEAMWVGCPETERGGLALDGLSKVRERIERATALLIGPGIGREAETQVLVAEILKLSVRPAVLDADALQPELVRMGKGAKVLTPHAGEFTRIAGGKALHKFATESGATVVLKGPVTKICAEAEVFHSFFGGPVLARGGSGDLLAGLIGGLLAQTPNDALWAAGRGVAWHGRAADLLARSRGQVAVTVTELLEFLPAVLHQAARPAVAPYLL
jgi:NAD(P)H-hydrate epimerase